MAKPTAEEILRAIETADEDADIEEILAMTPEEVRQELLDGGFTEAEIDEPVEAFIARALASANAKKGKTTG